MLLLRQPLQRRKDFLPKQKLAGNQHHTHSLNHPRPPRHPPQRFLTFTYIKLVVVVRSILSDLAVDLCRRVLSTIKYTPATCFFQKPRIDDSGVITDILDNIRLQGIVYT